MKVIFLDVDGVLNSVSEYRFFGADFINDSSVSLVSHIIKETGAKIILSSSWRIDREDKEIITKRLSFHNIDIFDCTPIIEGVSRSEEIQEWLNDNKVEKFAILDDDSRANIGLNKIITLSQK